MPDRPVITQAALIYTTAPNLPFGEMLEQFNEAIADCARPALMPGPMSTEEFALFTNVKFHASIAIHRGALGTRGLDRALAATGAKAQDFEEALHENRVHVILSVGDGPNPVCVGKSATLPSRTRLTLLFTLLRIVTRHAMPEAAHICPSDRLFTGAELDAALTGPLPPELMIHPATGEVEPGPSGQMGRSMVLHQSHHLIGRTLVLEGIPEPVPHEMRLDLADTLLRQRLKGKLSLEDGETVEESLGMALHIRHAEPDAAFPEGRVIASFWETPPDTAAFAAEPFTGHPGYTASPLPAPETVETDARDWSPDLGRSHGAATASRRGPQTWMVLLGISLFLWIGLPLLDVPQKIIAATFSNDLNAPFSSR